MKKIYYFDNNASTFPSPSVIKAFTSTAHLGNPNNTHHLYGRMGQSLIDKSQKMISKHLDVPYEDIIFTNCASEANNIVIQCIMPYLKTLNNHSKNKNKNKKNEIIISTYEHNCLLSGVRALSTRGFKIVEINPAQDGLMDPAKICTAISPRTIAVMCIHAHNELGILNDISKIAHMVHKKNPRIWVHSDCVQSMGKYHILPRKMGVDSMCWSAHKFNGFKRIGGLYIRNYHKIKENLTPLIYGGVGHDLIGGTPNPSLIYSMAIALSDAHKNRIRKNAIMERMRQEIIDGLIKQKIIFKVLGASNKRYRMPNTLLIAFGMNVPSFCNGILIDYLDKHNIACSIGSACNTTNMYASHVLNAIGAPKEIKHGVIRISLGDLNTLPECRYLIKHLSNGVRMQK